MGRDKRKERAKIVGGFTPMSWNVMETRAWRSLTPVARCIYVVLRTLAYRHGNGGAGLAVRRAAEEVNVTKNTALKAMHELQARGFIVPVKIGCLGVSGEGKATVWRLTELSYNNEHPSREFADWKPGSDFEPAKGAAPIRRKQKPVPNVATACPSQGDTMRV